MKNITPKCLYKAPKAIIKHAAENQRKKQQIRNNQNKAASSKIYRDPEKATSSISKILDEIQNEINVIRERDPAAKSKYEVLLLYSGLHAVLAYRAAHTLYLKEHYFQARLISQLARFLTGIEIHPGATIGKGLFIDHGSGVVIGETTEIGDDCTIYQGVTLGGTGKDTGKRHPTIGNNVMIGSGAKVLGPFKIGNNSKIASNAVVLEEVPENSTAVGIPARVVKRNNCKVQNFDQIHIPDPVSQELCKLQMQIDKLEKALLELSGNKDEKSID